MHILRLVQPVMLYVLAFLMVSNIPYNSFKNASLYRKMNFNVLVAAILVLIFIAAQPSIALFSLCLTYVVAGPETSAWRYRRRLKSGESDPQEIEDH